MTQTGLDKAVCFFYNIEGIYRKYMEDHYIYASFALIKFGGCTPCILNTVHIAEIN